MPFDSHKVLTNDDKVVAFNFQNINTANQYIDEYSPCTLFPEYHEFSAQTYAVGGDLKISGSAYVYDKKPNEVVNLTLTPSSQYIFDHYEISSNGPKKGPLSGTLNGNQYTFGYGDVKIGAYFKYDAQTGRMLYLTEFDNVVNGIDTPITSKVGSTYDLKSAGCIITTSVISSIDSNLTGLNSAYKNKKCLVITPTANKWYTNNFPVGSSKSANYTVSYWYAPYISTASYYHYGYATIPGFISHPGYMIMNLYSNYYNTDSTKFLMNGAAQTAYNGATASSQKESYGSAAWIDYQPNFTQWHYISVEVQNNKIYRYFIDGVKVAQQSGTINTGFNNLFNVYNDYYDGSLINDKFCIAEYCVRSGFYGSIVPTEPFV